MNIGDLILTGTRVTLENGVSELIVDSVNIGSSMVYDFETKVGKVMELDSYRWFIIKRNDDIGIRLKNLEHPDLAKDINIQYFDYNPELVVEATFALYPVAKKLRIDNVLGHQFDMDIRGQLQFDLFGKSHTLEPMDEEKDFFIIFSDETSAIETYGSGRYLHADFPKPGGKVLIDFNLAYNPPCAFTDFATCFLPPAENQLSVRIEAGEFDYHMK
jgi:hypothetical protein